jgi:hypothetical protein
LIVYYKEPARNIRRTIGYLISAVYGKVHEKQYDLKRKNPQLKIKDNWPDVFSSISIKTGDNSSNEEKEIGLVLLGILLEEGGIYM